MFLSQLSKTITRRQFSTNVFTTKTLDLYNREESVIKNNIKNKSKIEEGFKGVNTIGIIGWGSQAPAQALNLRDSLKDTYINVNVGLRETSKSFTDVENTGFSLSSESNKLGEMYDIISQSDMVLYLISDYAQIDTYTELFKHMKPGSTLGLSHGFLLGHFDKNNIKFPDNINVVMVAPKGMGPSVRELYLKGTGINSSIAVHQDYNGLATDHAISWALGIGSPYVFETGMRYEYVSDIYGERGILLGAIYGMSEYLFRHFNNSGLSKKKSYETSAYNITGTINRYIRANGIKNLYTDMCLENKKLFSSAYTNTYYVAKELLQEIYDEVKSGNEINSVLLAGKRFKTYPIGKIDGTEMWQIEKQYRNELKDQAIEPTVAGIYIATMMAQIDILMENGHNYSEIVNESIIEATDSLNPYLYDKGISHMIDNCSVTARLGARKWGPRFDYLYSQNDVIGTTIYDNKKDLQKAFILMEKFTGHPIHHCLDSIKNLTNT